MHPNVVLSEEVLDYSVLFAEIADAYFEREMYAEAKPIYELLGGNSSNSSMHEKRRRIAGSRRRLWTWLVFPPFSNAVSYILGGISVRFVDPANNDAKMKLADIYEING